jgi:hypothetical protein
MIRAQPSSQVKSRPVPSIAGRPSEFVKPSSLSNDPPSLAKGHSGDVNRPVADHQAKEELSVISTLFFRLMRRSFCASTKS